MNFYKRCLSIDALFEGGRMLVGATSVAYLLDSGLGLDKVAYLKSIQAMVLLAGELPTGVFADSFGRRKSLVAAALVSALGFLLFASGDTFLIFALAECLTALALCFWSGAYEAFAIDRANLQSKPGLMDKYFHQNQSLNSLSVLSLGWMGGWLASTHLAAPYWAGLLCFVFLIILILKTPPSSHDLEMAAPLELAKRRVFLDIGKHLKVAVKEGLLHPVLFPFFLANIFIQFSIQPLLHFWQPTFLSFGPESGTRFLGFVFGAYCGGSALAGFAFSKLGTNAWARSRWTTLTLFCLYALLYVAFAQSRVLETSLLLFVLLQSVLSLARTSLGIRMNELIPSGSRASVLSALGLISRIGMMIALAWIAHMSQGKASGDSENLFKILESFSRVSLVIVLLIMAGMTYKNRGARV